MGVSEKAAGVDLIVCRVLEFDAVAVLREDTGNNRVVRACIGGGSQEYDSFVVTFLEYAM